MLFRHYAKVWMPDAEFLKQFDSNILMLPPEQVPEWASDQQTAYKDVLGDYVEPMVPYNSKLS